MVLKVNDILPTNLANLKVVLILESPYSDEVVHKHPLAGDSGQSVTDYIKQKVSQNSPLKNFTCPLGCELKNFSNSELGVMNFSLYPLDSNVCCQLSAACRRHSRTIEAFRIIRENPVSASRNNKYVQKIENFLKKNFRNRIQHIVSVNKSCVFVPCGKVAEAFLKKINSNLIPEESIITGIPHPSRNQWGSLNDAIFNCILRKL